MATNKYFWLVEWKMMRCKQTSCSQCDSIMMCEKTRDYDHETTLMSEYCISDVDTHLCRECYYGSK